MRVRIEKRGNTPAVRIPASVMTAATLKIGQHVEVRAEGGRVVIEPIVVLTTETLDEQVDFGPPVGKEIW